MRRIGFTSLALSLVLGALEGCVVYDPSLIEDSGPPDAGPCDSRLAPTRPSGPDGDDGEEYFFGLRQVVLNQQDGDAWRNIGLNLDGHCTGSPSFTANCLPPSGRRSPADGEGGIDNVFGAQLFPLVEFAVPNLEMNARETQDAGALPAFRIRGWNGEDNDSRIDLTLANVIFTVQEDGSEPVEFVIDGFEPRAIGGGLLDPPRWDGTDYGYLRDDNFFEGDPDRPLLRDDNAFIADRQVVARLPERVEILFPAENAGVRVLVTDSTVVGTLSADLTSMENVVVSGRWAILDLLATAETVGVCRTSESYGILSMQLDTIADVRSSPGTGGPGVSCDAVSLGVGFTGTRMQFGGLVPGPPVNNLCDDMPDGGVDGGTDSGLDGGTDAEAGPGDTAPPTDTFEAGSPLDGGP